MDSGPVAAGIGCCCCWYIGSRSCSTKVLLKPNFESSSLKPSKVSKGREREREKTKYSKSKVKPVRLHLPPLSVVFFSHRRGDEEVFGEGRGGFYHGLIVVRIPVG